MSASNIDMLLDLWASTLLKHNDLPPFTNHQDLYDTIDSTPLGNVPWQSFSVTYSGELLDGDVPQWMTSDFDIWFCDPHIIVKNMISNPDYNHYFDTAPVQVFDHGSNRMYHNFMSGDWAWEEAVCVNSRSFHHANSFIRTK